MTVSKLKTKGKKKGQSLDDKVRKKLHLNKQDRGRVIKQKKRLAIKKAVEERVKENMAELGISGRTREPSVASESSFGSVPPPKRLKKRVSFSATLCEQKEFKKTDEIEARLSEASPGRSILSTPNKKSLRKAAAAKANTEIADADDSMDGVEESTDTPTPKKATTKVPKIKPVLQVPKKVKEQLMNMPRKERKAFLVELRKKQKPNLTIANDCKALWERARMKKVAKDEKDEIIRKLVGLVKGHAKQLIYAHDMSRIFQYLLKLEREGITEMLFHELSSELVRMSKSPYARFFVKRMLKYGSRQQRSTIIDAFRGHAVAMLGNVFSADILESVYNEYANAQQRFDMITEFYGKEFVIFRLDKIKTLDEIIAAEPAKRPLITKYLEEILVDKCTNKITLRHSLVHKLMSDLLEHGDKDQKSNLLDAVKDKIPEIVHTPYGARVAMKCVWMANAKDRKLIVKNFKDLSVKAAKEKFGQRVLCTIFDQVDDTKLVNKFITSELGNHVGDLMQDRWGCLCLEYIAHPRDGRSMDHALIKELERGDGNEHSKKEKKDRYAEIFEQIANPLLTYCAANMDELIFGQMAPVTVHTVRKMLELPIPRDLFERKVEGADRIACYEAIAKLAAEEFIPMNPERFHLIESTNGGYLVGQLLRQDSRLPVEQRLSTQFITHVPLESLSGWLSCNKGCFVLLRMWEHGGDAVQKKLRKLIDVKRLERYSFVGARLLREALTGAKATVKKEVKEEPGINGVALDEDEYEVLDDGDDMEQANSDSDD
ncbi:unnamed protein product, partial [Mesorhabditis spiculigera]